MRRRRRVLAAATLGAAAVWLSVPLDGAWQRRTLADVSSTVEVLTRERLDGTSSLLLGVALGTGKISEIKAEVPSDRRATAGHLPEGWQHEQKGKQLRAWGPPQDDVNLRFNLNAGADKDYLGKQATLSAVVDGQAVSALRVTIAELEKVNVTPYLDGILTVPPRGTPGRLMMMGVADDYRRGTWELLGDGTSMPLVPLERLSEPSFGNSMGGAVIIKQLPQVTLDQLLAQPAPRPFVTVFPESGTFTMARYTDRWGEVLVEAPLMIAPMPPLTCSRGITSGAEFTFAGQAACVAGCFPDPTAAYGFMLDGTIPVQPWAVSPTTAMFGIPADAAPGAHTIGGAGVSNTVTIGVLGLQGSIDQSKLWTGQSTTMRLRILGTDRQLPLVVLNRTPGSIDVEGGAHQMVTTPGGADNGVTRNVRGIRKGRFQIVYSLSLPGCGSQAPRP